MFEWMAAAAFALGIWLSAHGIQPAHIVAGLLGGLARALISRSGSKTERLVGSIVGVLFAIYATPLAAWWLAILDPSLLNALAFSMGLIGLSLAEMMLNLAKLYTRQPGKLRDDLREFILRVLGKSD